MNDRGVFTKEEVAAYIGVTPRTISNWVQEGRIPFLKLGDAKQSPIRFPKSAIDNWMEVEAAKALHPSTKAQEPDIVRRRPRRIN